LLTIHEIVTIHKIVKIHKIVTRHVIVTIHKIPKIHKIVEVHKIVYTNIGYGSYDLKRSRPVIVFALFQLIGYDNTYGKHIML
jgi:hypothetical protein